VADEGRPSTITGAEINTLGGFVRARAEFGAMGAKQIDNFAVYGAAGGAARTTEFRNFSQSDVAPLLRLMSAIATTANEFSSQYGPRRQQSSAPPPLYRVELLNQYWGARSTPTPQTSANQVGYLNLDGEKVEGDPDLDGSKGTGGHVRAFNQNMVDGNPTGCAALC